MKRKLLQGIGVIMVAFIGVTGFSSPGLAQEATLEVVDSSGCAGTQNNYVEIELTNSVEVRVRSLQFTISDSPGVLTATGVETTSRSSGFYAHINDRGAEGATALLASFEGNTISPGTGLILKVLYDVDSQAQGNVNLALSEVKVIDSQNRTVSTAIINGIFEIIIGDLDCDGVLDDVDNCSITPNGPALGTCFNFFTHEVGGECLDHSSCQESGEWWKWCDTFQIDIDSDGLGDVCDNCPDDPDNDTDNDGICGDIDNCPEVPNGPALGSCFHFFTHEAWGECLDHSSCQESGEWWRWCDTFQNDLDSDEIGDVCDD